VNTTRYRVSIGGDIGFLVEGNATTLEWRDVDLEDTWHEVEPVDGEWNIPINDIQFSEESNMTMWVRAAGSEGVSPPVYLHLHVHTAESEKDEGDELPLAVYAVPPIVLLAVLIGYTVGRKKNDDSW